MQCNIGIGYGEAGRRIEALQLTEEVVRLQKSKLGEDILTQRHQSGFLPIYRKLEMRIRQHLRYRIIEGGLNLNFFRVFFQEEIYEL